jgi:hypothetical protein
LISAPVAHHLGLGDGLLFLVRVAGNADLVAAQREALAGIGDIRDVAPDVWHRLRTIEPADATVLRLSGPTARFADLWSAAERVATTSRGLVHASVLRAVARIVLPQPEGQLPDAAVATLREAPATTRIFERLPAHLWPMLAPSATSDRLSRGVRSAFDPHELLNPGIFGDSA